MLHLEFALVLVSLNIACSQNPCTKPPHSTAPGDGGSSQKSLESTFSPLPTDPALTKFLLYPDRTQPTFFQEIQIKDKQSLDKCNYQRHLPLKVIIHGFRSDATDAFPVNTKNALLKSLKLKTENFNILIFDWGKLASAGSITPIHYFEAVANVNPTGNHVANFLTFLFDEGALNSYSDVHLIGFSLGAHVAGVVGHEIQKQENGKIGRITGLDPAGPAYDRAPDTSKKLDAEDANFVETFHTNGGMLGTREASGHVDFYPNGGGPNQPGCCDFLRTGECQHTYAADIYIEIILNPQMYKACKCEPWDWSRVECTSQCSDEIFPGETPQTARGSYFFETRKYIAR